MVVENLFVVFDHTPGVFYAGQNVTGRISFHVTKPINSNGVNIQFSGRADTEWTVNRTTGKQKFYAVGPDIPGKTLSPEHPGKSGSYC